jgi:hypothetical protein
VSAAGLRNVRWNGAGRIRVGRQPKGQRHFTNLLRCSMGDPGEVQEDCGLRIQGRFKGTC